MHISNRRRFTLCLSAFGLIAFGAFILSMTPTINNSAGEVSVAVAMEPVFFSAYGMMDEAAAAQEAAAQAQPVLLKLTQRLTNRQPVAVATPEFKSAITVLQSLLLTTLGSRRVLLGDLKADLTEDGRGRMPNALHYFLEKEVTQRQCQLAMQTVELMRPIRILFWQTRPFAFPTGPGWDCIVANATIGGWSDKIVLARADLTSNLFGRQLSDAKLQRDLMRTQILLMIGGALLSPDVAARRSPDSLLNQKFVAGRQRTFQGAVATHDLMMASPLSTFLFLWQQLLFQSLQAGGEGWVYEFSRITDLLLVAFPDLGAAETLPNFFEVA